MNLVNDYTKRKNSNENVTEVRRGGFGEESREPRCRNRSFWWD
jgi:hypothetical protein